MRLLPLLLEARAPRVVTMSSLAAVRARIRFDDLQSERRYRAMAAYGQSKLADLMMARRLAAVADDRGWPLLSTAAHPGLTRTNLPHLRADTPRAKLRRVLVPVLYAVTPAQGTAQGAEPLLHAAADPDVVNGGYYGPAGRSEIAGPPVPVPLPQSARDEATAEHLWKVAETLTGVGLPVRVG